MTFSNFHERLEYAISHSSWEGDPRTPIDISAVYTAIQAFENEHRLLLMNAVWDDPVLDLKRQEFSLLLTLFAEYYERQSKVFLNEEIIIHRDDQRPFGLAFIYLLRFLIQDIIQLRNLASMKFENQLNATLRNAMEKMMLLSLILFDYEFAKEYAFHDNEELTRKERYYKFLRPGKLLERIRTNYNNIILKEEETGIAILGRGDKDFYNLFLDSRVEEIKDLLSLFTHTHDMGNLFSYYNEGDKFNVSLKHNASLYLYRRIDNCLHFLVRFFNKLVSINFSKEDDRLYDVAIGYMSVFIEDMEKPS
jgi:hypothetical protein